MPIDANVDVVARTLIGEARGQGILDMLAVAAVIRERVCRPGWWGRTWEEVCKKPWQFTCWQDHNLKVMQHAEVELPKIWLLAWTVADLAVHRIRDRDIADLFGTKGPFPTHYHDRSIPYPEKAWGPGELVPTPWESAFLFYRGIKGVPKRMA